MSRAPIILFVYNRPEHTRKTIEALQKNALAAESKLIIYSDGPRNASDAVAVKEVRDYIRAVKGFASPEIVERDANLGLAKSIISGVTETVNKYGKVIVMEDDLVSSPFFLTYMNEGLDLYEKDERVASIHGYIYPDKKPLPETFFLRGADCWGWGTWKRAWDIFEPDGKKLLQEIESRGLLQEFDYESARSFSGMLRRQIEGANDSWAIRWHASAFLANKLTLYPGISLIDNIGHDSSGQHSGTSNAYSTEVSKRKILIGNIAVEENREARDIVREYFRGSHQSKWHALINRFLHR